MIFGVEPTAYYWYPLYQHLREIGHTVCLLNPISVSNNRKTLSEDQSKTDPKDAYAIYDLMTQGKFFFTAPASKKQF